MIAVVALQHRYSTDELEKKISRTFVPLVRIRLPGLEEGAVEILLLMQTSALKNCLH